MIDTPETIKLLESFIQPLLKKQVDTIVLGCTHYSFLTPLIRNMTGDSISLIDTSRAIAEQLVRVLGEEVSQAQGNVSYFTTGSIIRIQTAMKRLLGQEISVSSLNV